MLLCADCLIGVDQLAQIRVWLGLIPFDFKSKEIENAYIKKQVVYILESDMCVTKKCTYSIAILFGDESDIAKKYRNTQDGDSTQERMVEYIDSAQEKLANITANLPTQPPDI